MSGLRTPGPKARRRPGTTKLICYNSKNTSVSRNLEQYREITAKHITQWKLALQYGPGYKIADKIPKDAPKLIGNGAVARKLSSVSSLFTFYCSVGAMKANPFKVISRPSVDNHIGKSKIINEAEARKLLSAPLPYTIKGKRDRAILSTFLYHGLRRAEVCDLKMKQYVC